MSLHAATRTRSLTPTSCPDPGPGPGANAGPGSGPGPGHLVEPGQSQPPLLEYAVVVTSAREHHHPLRPRPARRLACRPARRQVDRGQKHGAGATRVQRLARRHRVCLAADGSLRELLGLELVGRQHRRQRQRGEGALERLDAGVPRPRVVFGCVADVEVRQQPGVAILLAHVPAVHPVIVARPITVGLVVLAHQIVDGLGAVLGAQPLYGRGRVGVEQRLVEELGHLALGV